MSMMMVGASAWRRGGGDAPVGPFDPSILSGLTFAFSAQASAMYKGVRTSGGAAALDNDPVRRIDSISGISRCFADSGANFTLKTSSFGASVPAIQGSGELVAFVQPVGDNLPVTSAGLSVLTSAGAKLILWAGAVDSANANAGQPYQNDAILSDAAGYCGLHCYQDGGDIIYQWYNYASSAQVRAIAASAGQPVVIACRHDGGELRVALNDVSWSAAASSGNTGSMNSSVLLGKTGSGFVFRTSALVTCNNSSSDANVLAVIKQMGDLVGLVL